MDTTGEGEGGQTQRVVLTYTPYQVQNRLRSCRITQGA